MKANEVTSDQSIFLLKESKVQARISLRILPEARANKITVFKVKMIRSAFAKDQKVPKWGRATPKDICQLGIAQLAEGLSLWTLAIKLFNSKLQEIIWPEEPSPSAIEVSLPALVLGFEFLSVKRWFRKSATWAIEGLVMSTWFHFCKMDHLESYTRL